MNAELAALEKNETWTLTTLPPGHKPITSKGVYKTKYHQTGIGDKLKTRLVVGGFNQKEGLDYKHTFSPIAKLATVRVLVALETAKQWHLHLLDVNNAFLHGYIDEEIYMLPPEGYHKALLGQVCKLNRSLYGLKQASRQWNHELTKFLVTFGYVQSIHDYSLFVKSAGQDFTAVLVCVDDMLITGNSNFEILSLKASLDHKFTINDLALVYVDDVLITRDSEAETVYLKQALDKKFTLKDLGLAKYFIELCCCSTGTHLNQRKYIVNLLSDIGLTAAKPETFPLSTELELSLNRGTPLEDPSAYWKLVGRLPYLTMTRPNISYAVQHLSQFVSAPKDVHMQAAMHLLR
nr:hypothetical protein [Tanacetum cinerariifolium]